MIKFKFSIPDITPGAHNFPKFDCASCFTNFVCSPYLVIRPFRDEQVVFLKAKIPTAPGLLVFAYDELAAHVGFNYDLNLQFVVRRPCTYSTGRYGDDLCPVLTPTKDERWLGFTASLLRTHLKVIYRRIE